MTGSCCFSLVIFFPCNLQVATLTYSKRRKLNRKSRSSTEIRGVLTTRIYRTTHNHPPLERFFGLPIVVLLPLRAECSLFTLKPARSSCFLPTGFRFDEKLTINFAGELSLGQGYVPPSEGMFVVPITIRLPHFLK
jgi:hypothetical protein